MLQADSNGHGKHTVSTEPEEIRMALGMKKVDAGRTTQQPGIAVSWEAAKREYLARAIAQIELRMQLERLTNARPSRRNGNIVGRI